MDREADGELLSIGEFSALTGLTPRALRLYDDAGVLVPAVVEQANGYRRYRRTQLERAELVRLLRLADVPLAAMGDVLDAEEGAAIAALDLHEQAVDARHQDGRRAASLVRDHLARRQGTTAMTITTIGRAALRHAVETAARCCSDTDRRPAFSAMTLRADERSLRVQASDAHCSAVTTIPCAWDGPVGASVLVPPGFLTSRVEHWPEEVVVELGAELRVDGHAVASLDPTENVFPGQVLDLDEMLAEPPGGQRLTVDAVALRAIVEAAPTHEVEVPAFRFSDFLSADEVPSWMDADELHEAKVAQVRHLRLEGDPGGASVRVSTGDGVTVELPGLVEGALGRSELEADHLQRCLGGLSGAVQVHLPAEGVFGQIRLTDPDRPGTVLMIVG